LPPLVNPTLAKYMYVRIAERTLHWVKLIDEGVCIDEPSKWTTRELRQIHTADPGSRDGRKVAPVTTLYSTRVNRHDFLPIVTGSAVGMYLAQKLLG